MRTALACTSLVTLLTCTQAGPVKTWRHDQPAHFARATFFNTAIRSDGALFLGRPAHVLPHLTAEFVWAIAPRGADHIYVGTGQPGMLLHYNKTGKWTSLFHDKAAHVTALAPLGDGTIVAAVCPGGRLIRITPTHAVQEWCRLPAEYIWTLVESRQHDSSVLFAGTGPGGLIYTIASDGTVKPYYNTRQEHVLALAFSPSGDLYAATENRGRVYRISATNQGYVLFEAPQNEIRSVIILKDRIYAATGAPRDMRVVRSRSQATSQQLSRAPQTGVSDTRPDRSLAPEIPVLPLPRSAHVSTGSSPEPQAAVTSGFNALYALDSMGRTTELYKYKGILWSLAALDERLYIAAGTPATVIEFIPSTRAATELLHLDSRHATALATHGSNLFVATSDPATVVHLDDGGFAKRGTVVSPPLDAGVVSTWGSINWYATQPTGTLVTAAVRCGNVPEPDDTWTEWSAEIVKPGSKITGLPHSRYIQYRLTLTTDKGVLSPLVHWVELRYGPINMPPHIESIEVTTKVANDPSKLRFKWKASDANGDTLEFHISLRRTDWSQWITLANRLTASELEMDSTTLPDGVYRIRVMASDRGIWGEAEALQNTAESATFLVDHTPPTLELQAPVVTGDSVTLSIRATDALSCLESASYSLDGGLWRPVFPIDGLCDTPSEDWRIQLKDLSPGLHLLMFRVQDVAGNTATKDVSFSVNGKTKASREPSTTPSEKK